MKTEKTIIGIWTSLLIIVICCAASNSYAQADADTMMKNCCTMQNGKMMCIISGQLLPMDNDMIMNNGAKCSRNGLCILKNGETIQLKEGECMNMDGKLDKLQMMHRGIQAGTENKTTSSQMLYTCQLHTEDKYDLPGKCSKCGKVLIEKP